MARVFLDANVFLYAVGGEGPYRKPCRDLLAAVGEGSLDAVTNTEVLQEILHVRARRVNVGDATAAVRSAATLVQEVLPVTREDVLLACETLQNHPELGARDALHSAVMNNNSIHLLVSMDVDFDRLVGLKRLEPVEALRLAH